MRERQLNLVPTEDVAVRLTSRDRQQLLYAVLAYGAAQRLGRAVTAMLHYDRITDLLFPSLVPSCRIVNIGALRPVDPAQMDMLPQPVQLADMRPVRIDGQSDPESAIEAATRRPVRDFPTDPAA